MQSGVVKEVLSVLEPVSLQELNSRNYLSRYDTKFVINKDELPELLLLLKDNFYILEIDENRLFNYNNLYFDTGDLKLYRDHHNNKRERVKVRLREYQDSHQRFIEVKKKLNNNITDKFRYDAGDYHSALNESDKDFIENFSDLNAGDLDSVLNVKYKRITLLHKHKEEKITIDTDINYFNNGEVIDLQKLAVIELKQKRYYRSNLEKIIFNLDGIKIRISKYVIGIILTREGIKYNRFKEKLLKLSKMNYGYFNFK